MKLRTALLAATFIAAPVLLPGGAKAQPVTGPYVSAGLGYNILSSQKLKDITTGGTTINLGDTFGKSHALFHGGFTGEAAVGYGFGNGFRVELEGDYFNNQVKKVDLGNSQFVANGNERKYGFMANAMYDFDIGVPYMYPFIGGGIGYQWMDWRNVNATYAGVTGINNTEGSFAYQGIVGVAFPIPAAPGLSATVQYRYMGTTGDRTYHGYFNGSPASFKVGNEGNNMILVGLRYELFPPAPPAPAPAPTPVAAPAPAPARTYLVFFNWDSAALTPRAKQIVGEAAQASQSTKVTKLNVNGYTDTSGPAHYNMKLSLRRAHSVASELVADGVPKQDIVIKGYGETHLLVPTGPNVREPQNRRVEIILH